MPLPRPKEPCRLAQAEEHGPRTKRVIPLRLGGTCSLYNTSTSILLLLLQNTNINIEDGMATSFLGHTGMVCSLVAGGDSLGYFIECAHEQDQICP